MIVESYDKIPSLRHTGSDRLVCRRRRNHPAKDICQGGKLKKMKRIRFAIMAAGLVAIVGTMNSCKKESNVLKSTNTTQAKSTAKSLTTTEVNTYLAEVNNFLPYVEAVAGNPNTQIPAGLPTELSDDDMIRYVENSFNFTYAQQEDKLKNVTTDELILTLPKNANGKVNINEIAGKFIEAYNHVKQAYVTLSCPSDEKVLRVVDVELMSTSNSTVSLKLSSVFEWGYDPTTPVPSPVSITIPSGKWASFGSMGLNNITSLDPTGTLGAPEILNDVIKSNFGGYLFLSGAPKTKYSRYFVSNIEKVDFGFWSWDSGTDLPIAASAPRNPWLISQWGLSLSGMPSCLKDNNSLVFFQVPLASSTPIVPFADPLTDDVLNYMITWNDWVLRNKETKLNKYLYSFLFDEYLYSGTSSYLMYTRYANVYDRFSFPPVSKYTPIGGAIPLF